MRARIVVFADQHKRTIKPNHERNMGNSQSRWASCECKLLILETEIFWRATGQKTWGPALPAVLSSYFGTARVSQLKSLRNRSAVVCWWRSLPNRRVQRWRISEVKQILQRVCVLVTPREMQPLSVDGQETPLNQSEQGRVIANSVRDVCG